jgi:hypothetical protein
MSMSQNNYQNEIYKPELKRQIADSFAFIRNWGINEYANITKTNVEELLNKYIDSQKYIDAQNIYLLNKTSLVKNIHIY